MQLVRSLAQDVILAAAVLAAIVALWSRAIGPYIARPVARAISREIRETISEVVTEAMTNALSAISERLDSLGAGMTDVAERVDHLEDRIVFLENELANAGVIDRRRLARLRDRRQMGGMA